MSDVENPVEGAAPLPDEQPKAQEVTQESATAQDDTPKDEQPRDEGGRFQKRVNELTREKYQARREAEQVRRELEQARAELERMRQPPPPDPNADPWGHVQHLAREEARRMLDQERTTWQQQQEEQRFQTLISEHNAREQRYVADHPDYTEALDAFAGLVGVNPVIAELVMTSEHGPAVVHYLGNHLEEAARISQLPAHLAARELARLESRVSAPKPTPATKAPEPVPTLGGSSSLSKDPAKMTYAEYKKWRGG